MKTAVFTLIILCLASTQFTLAADAINETLQKGLYEEEANHNLDAAIKAYQAVIARHDEERKLAATAIFRLGECYRKLGRTSEAAAQYQRILREFPDQTPLVALSRGYVQAATSAQVLRPLRASPPTGSCWLISKA